MVFNVPTTFVPAVVADVNPVPALPEVRSFEYVVRYAGTPRLNPLVESVPTISVPDVLAEVKPFPAPAPAALAVTTPALIPKETPLLFECDGGKASSVSPGRN